MSQRNRQSVLYFAGVVALASFIVACGDDSTPATDSGTGTGDGGAAADTGTGMDSSTADAGDSDGGSGTGWVVRGHDCPGINRTDALWVDDDGSLWIGCGSGTVGDGLYVSTDDGASWEIPATSPANVLTSFRVLSVHRGYEDLVYVAGEGPAGAMVISLDTSSTPFTAEAVLTRGTTVDFSFLAGPFVTTTAGSAFADSFNGAGALYRANDTIDDTATDWTEASGWEDDGGTHQILDLVVVNDRFVGVGSTIAEPPYVFLPSMTGATYQMTPVQLVSGLGEYDGEMWGVAASPTRVVAVGVDQDNDIGKIFVSGADQYSASDYTQTDIDPLLGARLPASGSTWARGVCMAGDRIVVVGEIQPLGRGGFVLESTDGGASFDDITPDGSVASWSKCSIGGGQLVIAGAGSVALLAD